MSQVISDYTQITRLASFGTLPFAATTLTLKPGVSSQPVNNGEITVDLPNNSRLRFSAKGDDGQVRWFLPARYNHATNSLSIGDIGDIYKNGLQGNAAWNTTVIGQLAAAGIAPLDTDIFSDTVIIGAYAANDAYRGNGAVVMGNRALQDQEQIDHMTCLGDSTFRFATNVADGVAVGYVAAQEVRTGINDVFVGSYCGCYANASNRNVMVGPYAGARSLALTGTIGSYNIGLGSESMRYIGGTATQNIGIGTQSLFDCLGSQNTCVGYQSGMKLTSASAAYNVNIGYLSGGVTGLQKADCINGIAIGYNTYNTASNQVVLGNGSITETILRGNVTGIGGLDMSTNWQGAGPQNGSIWRASNILFFTMAPTGMQINNSTNTLARLVLADSGQLTIAPPASATPAANGQVTFEFTNNTTLTIKGRGSDGTVRSGTVTLS